MKKLDNSGDSGSNKKSGLGGLMITFGALIKVLISILIIALSNVFTWMIMFMIMLFVFITPIITSDNDINIGSTTANTKNTSSGIVSDVVVDGKYMVYMPVKATSVTSNFGYRVHPITKKYSYHGGVDLDTINSNPGDNVYPAYVVEVVDVNVYSSDKLPANVNDKDSFSRPPAGGQMVVMKHDIGGKTIYTLYMHLYRVKVKVGDKLGMNDILGVAGNTGGSQGAHLHFEMRASRYGSKLNPSDYIYCGGTRVEIGSDISGCFNYRPGGNQ